jgi:hypothetical protein
MTRNPLFNPVIPAKAGNSFFFQGIAGQARNDRELNSPLNPFSRGDYLTAAGKKQYHFN